MVWWCRGLNLGPNEPGVDALPPVGPDMVPFIYFKVKCITSPNKRCHDCQKSELWLRCKYLDTNKFSAMPNSCTYMSTNYMKLDILNDNVDILHNKACCN